MNLKTAFHVGAQQLVDAVFAVIPRPLPSLASLNRAKLIAHRGAHDSSSRLENTFPAFTAAAEAGVWGLEFDVRFTADGVPVIHHDVHTRRVFKLPLKIHEIRFEDLRRQIPLIPTLEEVVQTYGGRQHLMIEIKHRREGFSDQHLETIRQILSKLEPTRDFHIMALRTEIFDRFHWIPRAACLAIAETNVTSTSRRTIEQNYGGLTGHYLLLNTRVRARHDAHNQKIGTGFIGSRNALFRELNRGIEWLFTNDAVKMQALLNEERAKSQG